MARTYTYFVAGPFGTQSGRTCIAFDFRNSRGDEAVILHRNGGYDVSSAFFTATGFRTKKSAAHALIDNSPPGCCDWEEVGADKGRQ